MDVVGSGDTGGERAADDAGQQRSLPRDSLFLIGTMRIDGANDVHEVRIRNLSEGGLMAEFGRLVAEGTRVVMTLRGVGEVGGRVAWCTNGRLGIALDRAIDPVKARKPVGRGRPSATAARVLAMPRR